MKVFPFYLIIFSISAFNVNITAQTPASFVNPFIGTGGHGHTFPGACVPFGMVQLSPDTRIDGSWDGCSGYHYSDSIIYAFSHTHLSGTGCSDYGDVAFMPYYISTNQWYDINYMPQGGQAFTHSNEKAEAGYYQVELASGIQVALSATQRCGIQKYTFPTSGYVCITLNLEHRDLLLKGSVNQLTPTFYSGIRSSKAWAKNQELYYAFSISKDPIRTQIKKFEDKNVGLLLYFKIEAKESISIRTALSSVSAEGASLNLNTEMPNFAIDTYRKEAFTSWNNELSAIKVYGNDLNRKIIFYTALYHCMVHPSLLSDVDYRYRGRDGVVYNTGGTHHYYTVFSLWDTYRALHPLLALLDSTRTNDFIYTFLEQYKQVKRLPVWELWSNETDCMIGYHSVSVIWDAYNKGFRNFDAELAYNAMKSSAMEKTDALNSYMKYNYVRCDDDAESVSKTLEYAYDDWCIAQMAKAIHKDTDYIYFMNRATNWINVYDPISGYMRPRKNSTLYEPFSPFMVDNNFTEANSFQYSFYMPHAMELYTRLIGGTQELENKLDTLFTVTSKTEGREQADITGLIGQYAHGNEPSHHIVYLYPNETKKEKYLRYIMDSFYRNSPDGLIGNEDCGQMSAWYVWSAMGFYPVCPGNNQLIRGVCLFDSFDVKGSNRLFTCYKIKSNYYPTYSSNQDIHTIPEPFILPTQKIFEDSIQIYIASTLRDSIFYSVNQDKEQVYTNPIRIKQNTTLTFRSKRNNAYSALQEAKFYKIPNDKKVSITSVYNPQYHAGGPQGLIDGVHGNINWRKGDWQGYQGQNFEASIELDTISEIQQAHITFLQDQRSWIFFPKRIQVYTSTDGIRYTLQFDRSYDVKRNEEYNSILDVEAPIHTQAKFIKVLAENYGKIPSWHPGAGGESFIFIDEIDIR